MKTEKILIRNKEQDFIQFRVTLDSRTCHLLSAFFPGESS